MELALPRDQPSHGGHDVSPQARRAVHSWARIANESSLPQAPLKKTFSTKWASRRIPTRSSNAAAAVFSASVMAMTLCSRKAGKTQSSSPVRASVAYPGPDAPAPA